MTPGGDNAPPEAGPCLGGDVDRSGMLRLLAGIERGAGGEAKRQVQGDEALPGARRAVDDRQAPCRHSARHQPR